MLDLTSCENDEPLELIAGASKVREGKATRLVLTDAGAERPACDNKLVALLAEARATRDMCSPRPTGRFARSQPGSSVAGIASPS